LFVEGIRFPSSHRLDLGPTVGDNLQARVGFAFSPVDFIRSELLRGVGDADYANHELSSSVEDTLASADHYATRHALRIQAAYLKGHRPEWRALQARAAERFEARVITRVELHELRWLAGALDCKLAQVHGQSRRLENEPPAALSALLPALSERTLAAAGTVDRAVARLQMTDAWTFKITGGVIPMPGRPLDWYGFAEIGYSLGGIAHDRARTTATVAHLEQLRSERRELPARLARMQAELEARIAGAKEELAIVEEQLANAAGAERSLDGAEAAGAAHARDTLAIERLTAEADRVFLRALLDELTAQVEGSRGAS